MATTPLTLTVVIGIGTLATIAMFLDLDVATAIIVSVLAAIVWAIAANAALSVMVAPERTADTEAVWSLVYVSAMLALATGTLGVVRIISTLGSSAGATQAGGFLGR